MSEVASAKLCSVCGVDCSTMKRAKDAQGRYICGECLERAREARVAKQGQPVVVATGPVVPKPVAPATTPDGVDLVMDSLIAQSRVNDTKPCTECGFPIDSKAILCTHCGFNTITGKGTRIAVHKAPKERKQPSGKTSKLVSATTATIGGILGGVVAGIIGAALWCGVAILTHLEIGWIALAVGALAGAGTRIGAKGAANWATALYATGIAAAAILVGRYFAISMILSDIGLAGVPASQWFFDTFGAWDIVWAIMALPTAFQIGGGVNE